MSDSFSLNFPDNSQTTGDKGDKELQDFLMIEKQKAQLNAQVNIFSYSDSPLHYNIRTQAFYNTHG